VSSVNSRPTAAKHEDDYSTCQSTYATFRVYTGKTPPERVTCTLGIEPTELYANSQDDAHVNGWMLSSKNQIDSRDVRQHIDWLLERLRGKQKLLHLLQAESGVSMDVFCYWNSAQGQGGPSLDAEQMRQLADLNLDISFDCYFIGIPDE
jgi:Domain of unknown function (DUF4279)